MGVDLVALLNKPTISDFVFEFSDGTSVNVHKCIVMARAPLLFTLYDMENTSKAKINKDQKVSKKNM